MVNLPSGQCSIARDLGENQPRMARREKQILSHLDAPCRPSIRFLSISSRFSPSLPSPERSPFSELASDGGFFIFMFWYFHRGLEPRLQRAHSGHTQVGTSNSGQRPSLNSGFHFRRGWPRRSPITQDVTCHEHTNEIFMQGCERPRVRMHRVLSLVHRFSGLQRLRLTTAVG